MKYTMRTILFMLLLLMGANVTYAYEDSNDFTIPANTPIPLILDYNISSKKIKKGMEVEFKVAQDIFIGNNSIPQGTSAIGKVVKATKGKSWGRAGKLSIEIDRLVLANNTPLKLKTPNIEKEGLSKKGSAWTWFWCTILFVPLNVIPPLCIKGENTDIQQGFTFVAYTVEEQTVR